MKKLWEKSRISCLLFVFYFAVFTIVGGYCLANSDNSVIEPNEETQVNWQDYIYITNDCKIDGNKITMTGEDPSIMLDFSKLGKKVYGYHLTISGDTIEKKTEEQFFYANKNSFSNDESYYYSGQTDTQLLFDEETYFYRIDINADYEIEEFNCITSLNIYQANIVWKYILMCVVNVLLAFLFCHFRIIKMLGSELVADKKLKQFGIFMAGSLVISIALTKILSIISLHFIYHNKYRDLAIFVVLEFCFITYFFAKKLLRYAHLYIFFVCMLMGTLCVIATPRALGMSWDDETHYANVVYIADGLDGNISAVDNALIDQQQTNTKSTMSTTKDGRAQAMEIIDCQIPEPDEDSSVSSFSISYIAYIPAAFGIVASRIIGLNWRLGFLAGKFCNLMCYSLVIAAAVKRLSKRGKIIASMIAIIPTSIFMASQYSYDWWVICLSIYAYADIYEKIVHNEEMSSLSYGKDVALLAIATIPKALYILMMTPLLFLKNKRFKKPARARIITVLIIVLVVISFTAPILYQAFWGIKSGDTRGGGDVNSSAQVMFILNHPLQYAEILWNYLKTYLSLGYSRNALTKFAYWSCADYYKICYAELVLVMLVDNVKEKMNFPLKAITLLTNICLIILIPTALYVAYTPVGCNTVNGCQARYLLPLVFPFMLLVCQIDWKVNAKLKKMVFLASSVSFFLIYVNNLYFGMIAKY